MVKEVRDIIKEIVRDLGIELQSVRVDYNLLLFGGVM